jgi:hypothetical protein
MPPPGPPIALRRCVRLAVAAIALAGPATGVRADDRPLALVVNSDSPELTFGRARASLEEALGAEVVVRPPEPPAPGQVRGTVTITWRPTRRELAVTYQDERRGTVSRIVQAPEDPEQALASATALAANLVRDEAAELLGDGPPPEPQPGPAPAPRPPPPPIMLVAPAAAPPPPPRPYLLAVASLFYPLATNYLLPDVRTRLSVNGLYGKVGQLDGLQVGFGANAVDGPVAGAQLGMGFNVAGGPVDGFQTAILGFNYAEDTVDGFQASMGLNRSGGGRGLQLTFGLNRTAGPWRGLQAGGLNVAEDVHGMQVGFINVAGRVRGVQLGLINIAEDVEGIPIGLISVTDSGGVHPVFWTGSQSQATLGLKFSTRYTYTLLSGAARREARDLQFGPGLALGFRLPFLPGYFESDLGAHFLFGGPLCCVSAKVGLADDLLLMRWRSLFGYQIHHRFSLFAGASLTALGRFHEPTDARSIQLVPELFGGIQL